MEYDSNTARRMPNLKTFRELRALGERPRRPLDRKGQTGNRVAPPLRKEQRQEIIAGYGGRLFTGFNEAVTPIAGLRRVRRGHTTRSAVRELSSARTGGRRYRSISRR